MNNSSKKCHTLFTSLLVAVTLILITGCGAGTGQGLDENGNLLVADTGDGGNGGNGGGDGGGASGNPNATLAWVQSNVFGGVCTQCHTGAGAPLGVNWSSESNTCSNIGRTSGEISTLMEIDSGNPDASYVIWKIEGAGPSAEPIVGDQMPLSNPPLSADAINNIRDWISDGTPGCGNSKPSGSAHNTLGSWSEVWNESLRVCTLCHSIAPSSPSCSTDFECPPNGLVLTADNYFGVIDGRTVMPFDLERSILWNRINIGDHQSRLPQKYPALTQTQLNIIKHWIEGGAPFCPEGQVCQ